jgi:hypothetical protein
MKTMYVEGEVAFCNLKEFDTYQGKSTDKYTITVKLDAANADALTDAGVQVKDYKGTPQRKFATTYEVNIFNPDLSPWEKGEIPYGSKVKIMAKVSDEPYKDYGCSTYVNQVQVLEEAGGGVADGFSAIEPPRLEDMPEEVANEEDIPF